MAARRRRQPAAQPIEDKLLAVDLFAGAGGMTLGLKRAGFNVIAAVEIDALACETYRANHSDVRLWESDIRKLEPSELLAELGLKPRQLALVAGCPPCQGFSTITTLNGKRSVDDDRNDLVLEYGRFVRELRPLAVMMENVPGLAADPRMGELCDLLEELGYPARKGLRVLNAVDFGVPQRRRRLVMVAADSTVVSFAEPSGEHITVRQAIEDLPAAGNSGDPLHDIPEKRSPEVFRRICAIPRDGGSRADLGPDAQLKCHQASDGFKDIYGRMAWNKPAPTITGGCVNPSKGRFLHPCENRAITLREAAVLQGFPPNYKFSLSKGKFAAAAMIGNALPPAFVEAHAKKVVETLKSSSPCEGLS